MRQALLRRCQSAVSPHARMRRVQSTDAAATAKSDAESSDAERWADVEHAYRLRGETPPARPPKRKRSPSPDIVRPPKRRRVSANSDTGPVDARPRRGSGGSDTARRIRGPRDPIPEAAENADPVPPDAESGPAAVPDGPAAAAEDDASMVVDGSAAAHFQAAVATLGARLEAVARPAPGDDDAENNDGARPPDPTMGLRDNNAADEEPAAAGAGMVVFRTLERAHHDALLRRFGSLPSYHSDVRDLRAQTFATPPAVPEGGGGGDDSSDSSSSSSSSSDSSDEEDSNDGTSVSSVLSSQSSSSSATSSSSSAERRRRQRQGQAATAAAWRTTQGTCFFCAYATGDKRVTGHAGEDGRQTRDRNFLELLQYLETNYGCTEDVPLARNACEQYYEGVYRPPEVTRRLGLPDMPHVTPVDVLVHMEDHEAGDIVQMRAKKRILNRLMNVFVANVEDQATGLVEPTNVRLLLGSMRMWSHVSKDLADCLARAAGGGGTGGAKAASAGSKTRQAQNVSTSALFEARLQRQHGLAGGSQRHGAPGFNSASAGASATASIRAIEGRHAPPSFQLPRLDDYGRIRDGGGVDEDDDEESNSNILF